MADITKEQLDSLRELAENLTQKKFGNIKDAAKLQAIIDVARADKEDEPEGEVVLSRSATNKKREAMRKEATKLVRVNITPMSPFAKQLKGEMFDVGNTLIGSVRRYIPFDVDWHCEVILLDHIKECKHRTKREWKDPTTRKTHYENLFHKSYGVTVIDDLTKVQLEEHTRAMKSREYKTG